MALNFYARWIAQGLFSEFWTVGMENVPRDGGILFIVNHPNGLVDPLFVIGFSGRKVHFLAKEPLFKIPVVSWFVRGIGCIPIYRKRDRGSDVTRNRETFAESKRVLSEGNCIGIFPEGESHNRPELAQFRSGLLRICNEAIHLQDVRIVPCGLAYEDKSRFQSRALVKYGPPIALPPADVSPHDLRHFVESLHPALNREKSSAETLLRQKLVQPKPLRLIRPLAYWTHYPLGLLFNWVSRRAAGAELDLITTYEYILATAFLPFYWIAITMFLRTCLGNAAWLALGALPAIAFIGFRARRS